MESNDENPSNKKDFEDSKVAGTLGLTLSRHGRPLVNKLKKLKEGEDEEDEINPREKTHVCSECGTSFSSGRALGGHMSMAHVQANRGQNLKKLTSYQAKEFKNPRREEAIDLKDSKRSSNALTGQIICSFCGKDFRSKKSLSGHIKCHTERELRGMKPPAEHEEAEEEEHDNDDDDEIHPAPMVTPVVDIAKDLKGWSGRDRRGREAIKSPMASGPRPRASIPLDEEVINACDTLMILVNDKRNVDEEVEAVNSHSQLTPKANDKGVNQDFQSIRQRVDDDDHPVRDRRGSPVIGRKFNARVSTEAENIHSALSRSKVDKGKRNAQSDPESCDNIKFSKEYDYSYSLNDDSDSNNGEQLHQKYSKRNEAKMVVKSKKIVENMKPVDVSSGDVSPVEQNQDAITVATPDKYGCRTRHKCFPTYQALGSHRSTHNIHDAIDEDPISAAGDPNRANLSNQSEETKEFEHDGNSKMPDSKDQSIICNKNFATGQALGGHKKCHQTPLTEVSPEEATLTTRKNQEFDLNELPNMGDGDGPGKTYSN